ncbi:SDR family oxidoreductase [uncultured Friedmanniella sp.]|uniref:SDR family oxidoreductase n=1 Tax=uncultured Friedmanniella sp. TaxID=335381 RepID=UPI0035C98146
MDDARKTALVVGASRTMGSGCAASSSLAGGRSSAPSADRQLDLVFVNGAIANDPDVLDQVTTATFVEVMVTNALSPMRVLEALQSLVPPDGTLGVMSSTQGSISRNTNGGHEVYRASKSALNQLMRSYAARHADDTRTLLLMDPGWVQTELGGEGAPMGVDESVTGVVDTITAHQHEGGLHYLDYQDRTVPW